MAKRIVLTVDFQKEVDGRWIARVSDIPGVLVYGLTKAEAFQRVRALALEVLADREAHGEDLFTGHALKKRVKTLSPFSLEIRPGRQALAR